MLACRGREAMVMAPPYTWLSSITLLPWLPSFPPTAFPTTVFSLTSSRSVFLQSAAALTLGLLHNPKTPAPKQCTFQGIYISVQGMYNCGKDWFSCHLGCHRLTVSLSALMFLFWLRQLHRCGDRTPASVPPPAKGRSSPTNTVFPTSSFILPSFAWV